MNTRIEFFYDYVSVYSYLANSQLATLGAEIVYRPMLLGAVMQATGNIPPATIEAKGDYLRKDMLRWSERYGIELNWNPVFPQNTINALRLALAAQGRGEFSEIHQPLFDAIWVQDKDVGQPGTLASIVEDAGLSVPEYVAAISDQSIKDQLRANTEEAVSRGVFGGPTIFVGEELFFGNDRLEFVKAALADQAET